ncbi:MAG: hypothetical protein Q7S04_02985 [Candidatus Moranbacteria bacterium]|nr:hypothetical protein [Candidatus Moranbacteria bacterium]
METKDPIQKDSGKKWPKTLLKYLFAIIIIFVLLFSLVGSYEDLLDVSFLVFVLAVITVIALIAGGLLTGYEHVKPIADKFEDENVWQYIRMAIIRLLIGGFIIYWMIGGEGFLSLDSLENIVHNLGKFSLWIFAIYFVLAGLKSLYWVIREVIKNLTSDGDED